jgi:DNA-binding IclR family transcriptional regulator
MRPKVETNNAFKKKTEMANIKSAARALDILELVAEFPDGLTLTDIGKNLDIPLSSLYGLIMTMVNKSYLIRSESTRLYCLGPRLSQIASSYRAHTDLISLADPIMDRIRQATGEATSLTLLQGDSILFIHKRITKAIVQIVNPIGTRLPAHATGSGKAMLAYLADDEIDRLYPEEELPALTPFTITTKKMLKAVLAEIRIKGYAYDNQESELGVWAVSSCIRGEDGRPEAALSVGAPLFRIQTKNYTEWHKLIKEGAQEISALLGFRANPARL